MKNSIFLALLFSFFLIGCGGGGDELSVYPVTGKITKGGSGMAGVNVSLIPQGQTESPMLVGITAEDGSFEILTSTGLKGAPAGEYKIVLAGKGAEMDYSTGQPKKTTGKDSIPKKYASEETTDESITVSADGKNVITIEIP